LHNKEIPVLILPDAHGKSWLSLEAAYEKDGYVRLFKEFSDPSFRPNREVLERLGRFLDEVGGRDVRFEDNRSGSLSSLLRRLRYARIEPYRLPKGVESRPAAASVDDAVDGMRYFGLGDGMRTAFGDRVRRIDVTENGLRIGTLMISDYGRFARAKANRFGSEGVGLVAEGKDPSIILLAVALRLLQEGKRYMILGCEYEPYLDSIHPFPLWHMRLTGKRRLDHSCRLAGKPDVELLSRLTCEYEDTDIVSATSTVLRNLSSPEFKYLLHPGGKGFALLKLLGWSEGMIHDLYVSPMAQGKGVGDELTRGSISVLSEDCTSIHLNTIYPRARRLYEKYGFEIEYTDFCVALNQTAMSRA